MESRYRIAEALGDGSFGTVWRGVHCATGEVVAIKRMKRRYGAWEECLALREVQVLRDLRHPAVVRLREVVREGETLFLVFEYVGPNLYEISKDRRRHFPEATVRSWLRQLLQALAYLHGAGLFHRDIKPENLLVRGGTIKLADFGLVRPLDGEGPYTEYVSTRWYRAPEVLLRAATYGAPVDIFAVGAVAAELYALKPLFPGGTEADQLACICGVMGCPTEAMWPQGLTLAQQSGFYFQPADPLPLASVLPAASAPALDLIALMLSWDPNKRPTAEQALRHPFFHSDVAPALPRAAVHRHRMLQAAACKADTGETASTQPARGAPAAKPSGGLGEGRERAYAKREVGAKEGGGGQATPLQREHASSHGQQRRRQQQLQHPGEFAEERRLQQTRGEGFGRDSSAHAPLRRLAAQARGRQRTQQLQRLRQKPSALAPEAVGTV